MSPRETLMKGASLLEPVLGPHGFSFVFREEGRGSGGVFAVGDFVRGDRRLEIHLRHSVGLVSYHLGAAQVSHGGYMEELGVRPRAAYPGFSDDPLDGFRHLADDLERFAEDFLAGDGALVLRAAERERERNEARSRELMAGYTGDVERREQAKQKFDAGDWAGAIRLLESLRYPDQMDASDQRRLEIAKRHAGDE